MGPQVAGLSPVRFQPAPVLGLGIERQLILAEGEEDNCAKEFQGKDSQQHVDRCIVLEVLTAVLRQFGYSLGSGLGFPYPYLDCCQV